MATTRDDRQDEVLLRDLRRLLAAVDPVPAHCTDFAVAALSWRDADAELARLAEDTSLAAAGGPLLRAAEDDVRLLSFEGDTGALELAVTLADAGCELTVQVVPPAPAMLRVRHLGGEITVATNEVGVAAGLQVAAGPVQVRADSAATQSGKALVTPWFDL